MTDNCLLANSLVIDNLFNLHIFVIESKANTMDWETQKKSMHILEGSNFVEKWFRCVHQLGLA